MGHALGGIEEASSAGARLLHALLLAYAAGLLVGSWRGGIDEIKEDPVHDCAESLYGPNWSVPLFGDASYVEKNPEFFSSEPLMLIERRASAAIVAGACRPEPL